MNTAESLKVTSHVGRDLLAAAASFKTEAAAIWEYVVNSLQYVEEGVLPKIQVIVKPRNKVIEILDNGRGMTADGLSQFFTMHGENIDRVRGRPGRGKFGTGKSAAFGIGKILRVDTRRDGLRNVVQLHRDTIEASSGEDIDLDWMIRNESTEFPNGTTVAIEEIFLPKLTTNPVIEYIERHLQIFRARMPEVAVNEHVCQYREPSIAEVHRFHPNPEQARIIGNVELTIKVSTAPLPSVEQGVTITAGLGNLVAIETAGIEAKEFGNYLLGDIDVIALESTDSPIEPYDVTRSLQLNPQHPVVRILLPFIGSKLEEVRKQQVQKLRSAQKTEEARRLASEAQRIADILNKDFKSVMGKLQDIRSASARPGDVASHFGNTSNADMEEGVWIEGTSTPGDVDKPTPLDQPEPEPIPHPEQRPDPTIVHTGQPNEAGEAAVDAAGGAGHKKHRPRGGFNVDFRNLGDDSDRSKYDRTGLTIIINLDHPVVKNALRKGSVEDLNFRRLAYEIAFTEYSLALGFEMVEQDPDMPADDILYEVRSTLNRVSASAASLYG